MNNEDAAPRTIKTFLQELLTYGALLTPLLGPPLAWLGIGIDEKTLAWIIYAAVLPLLGLSWLVYQFRQAKSTIEAKGTVQRPAWLWRLLTNRITHNSEQLQQAQIMVIVPPGKDREAA